MDRLWEYQIVDELLEWTCPVDGCNKRFISGTGGESQSFARLERVEHLLLHLLLGVNPDA